jgi:hypothetical protein
MGTRYDMPDNYYFGGGSQDSFLTPLALVILLVAIVLIYCLPRKSMIVPLLAAGVLLPFGMSIVVLGFHFPALRLLVATGWLRFALRRDIQVPRMNSLDKSVLFWALCSAIFFSILWATMGAVTNRLGFLWTTLGTYFLVRFLIRDKADLVRVIRVLAILVAIIAPFMLIERFTQHNFFAILGSPPISAIRDGAIRAQGPFSHSIIAGTVGAMLLPLFIGLWWQGRRHRTMLGLGAVSSIGMAIASSSSTPLMTSAAGLFALLLWPFRSRLRMFRWVLVLSLTGLHLAMKVPVWFLISRMGGTIGGSGYHRAMLIDNFVRHFGEWWLIGTRNNASWGYDMWDVDNAFVAAGVGGGLITFIAFIAMLVYAYKRIGKSRRLAQKSRKDERLIWAIGASLFANTVGFFGIVYFDQSILVWYSLLAMVSATAMFVAHEKKTPVELEFAAARADKIDEGVPATASLHSRQYLTN